MRRNHWIGGAMMTLSAWRMALAVLGAALLLPASALGQSEVPNVLGLYRGFSQSDIDPSVHPRVELRVDRQVGSAFDGTLLMGAPGEQQPFTFKGKVDVRGAFTGKGAGPAGDFRLSGILEGLGDQGGALVLASYKLTTPDGEDKGVTNLLRSIQCPDPCVPPDIEGTWVGTSRSSLNGSQMSVVLDLRQVGFAVEGAFACGQVAEWGGELIEAHGTIDSVGHVVFIGVGDTGRIVVGGASLHPPEVGWEATYSRTSLTGAVGLGTLMVRRATP